MRWLVVAIARMSGISTAQEPASHQFGKQLPDAPIKVTAYRSDAHDKADDSIKYVIWNKKFTFAHVGEFSARKGEEESPRGTSHEESLREQSHPFCSHDGIRCSLQVQDARGYLAWVPYVSPAYASILHFKGGTEWVTRGRRGAGEKCLVIAGEFGGLMRCYLRRLLL